MKGWRFFQIYPFTVYTCPTAGLVAMVTTSKPTAYKLFFLQIPIYQEL